MSPGPRHVAARSMLAATRRATSDLREEDWPAGSEWTSVSESSKDRAGTSTRSLTPTSQLESCSEILRVFRERTHRQSGSTKRNPKRVRVSLSRTSRTDEAAEPHRLGSSPSRPVEKARKDAQSNFLSTSFLLTKTRVCHEFMPKTTRLATLSCGHACGCVGGLGWM